MDDTNSLIEQRKAKLAALRAILLAFACAFITGCFDTKQEITLNPDGSGKAVMESSFTSMDVFADTARKSTKPTAKDFVRRIIEQAQGVDAWRDVSYRQLDDGRIWFRGTAYFAELGKLKIGSIGYLRFGTTKDANGNLTIAPVAEQPALPYPTQSANEPITMETIQRERMQFRSAKPWMAALLGTMKQDTTFHTPGVSRRASNFETNVPNTLRIRFDGARLMQAVEEKLFDADFARERIAAKLPASFSGDDDSLNEKLYGQRGPVLAVIKPGDTPLFDYAAEVAQAKSAFVAIAKELGLSETFSFDVKPAVAGDPAKVKVTGIQWTFEGSRQDAWLFPQPGKNYVLSLRADLPGRVFAVHKVAVNRAVTVEGRSLLPRDLSVRDQSYPQISEGGTKVVFQVHLESPPLDSKGIAEFSGVLECASPENQRSVELISGKLRGGVKGTEYGVQIDDLSQRSIGGDKLVLRINLPVERLLSLKVIGDAGQAVTLERQGIMKIGEENIFTYISRNAVPRSGKLVAEVLVGSQTLRIPFSATNLTLLGQPLATR